MKVVHLNKNADQPKQDLQEEARLLENTIRYHPTNEAAYTRLMIVYRKLGELRKELKLINTAISLFEKKFDEKKQAHSKRVEALSVALRKATGLADKKGKNLYEWGELKKWKSRREVVKKKIGLS